MHPLLISEARSPLKNKCEVTNPLNELFWCSSIVIGHVRVVPVDYFRHEHVRDRILTIDL